jgi:hypothetical protein
VGSWISPDAARSLLHGGRHFHFKEKQKKCHLGDCPEYLRHKDEHCAYQRSLLFSRCHGYASCSSGQGWTIITVVRPDLTRAACFGNALLWPELTGSTYSLRMCHIYLSLHATSLPFRVLKGPGAGGSTVNSRLTLSVLDFLPSFRQATSAEVPHKLQVFGKE